MINIDDLAKCDIRFVKITEAERVEGSEKLVKLVVEIGDDTRQIIAGIGKSYSPEALIGKTILAIVNLEPRMMMGLESNGMILATGDNPEEISLVVPEKEVVAGAKIR